MKHTSTKLLAAIAVGIALLAAANAALAQRKYAPIFNTAGGKCLDRWDGALAGKDVSAGTCFPGPNQAFVVQAVMRNKTDLVGHLIRSYDIDKQEPSGLCLAPRNGQQKGEGVLLLPCNGHDPRQRFTMFGKGREDGTDFARFKFDQLCLDLAGGPMGRDPKSIIMWDCHGDTNQIWGYQMAKEDAWTN